MGGGPGRRNQASVLAPYPVDRHPAQPLGKQRRVALTRAEGLLAMVGHGLLIGP